MPLNIRKILEQDLFLQGNCCGRDNEFLFLFPGNRQGGDNIGNGLSCASSGFKRANMRLFGIFPVDIAQSTGNIGYHKPLSISRL